MSGQGLVQQVTQNTAAVRDAPTAEQQILAVIESKLRRIEALMPAGVVDDPKRMAAMVMVQIQQNPTLAQCSPESLVGCVFRVAQVGLELGTDLGHAFLIPRRIRGQMQCTLQWGFKGVLELARRSPNLTSIIAEPVHEKDEYEFERGYDADVFRHKKARGDRGPVVGAWCRWRLRDGSTEIIDIDRDEIERRKGRGGGGDAWKTDYPAMAAKSAVMAAKGYLPLTTQTAAAFHDDGAAITVSSRGPAALVATHDTPTLEAPDPETGEITPPRPPDDEPVDPDPEPPQRGHSETIGAEAGQEIHRALGRLKLPAPLHAAIVLRASRGRTSHASDLLGREAPAVEAIAKECGADPEAFAEWAVAQLEKGGAGSAEEKALRAWLAKQGKADPE